LTAYSIHEACLSAEINRVVLSTDSEKYAAIARKYGAEVPFLRLGELAEDHSAS
jgi:CMP-N,N'-diacetyllegionaminic acid synthase